MGRVFGARRRRRRGVRWAIAVLLPFPCGLVCMVHSMQLGEIGLWWGWVGSKWDLRSEKFLDYVTDFVGWGSLVITRVFGFWGDFCSFGLVIE